MPSHTVVRHVAAPVERVYDVVVAEDVLPKVLHRWGPIPAVTGTRDLTGPWDTPGSSRTVLLGDGSTARETVLVWERPRRFEYRVESFTNPLGRLIDHAVGAWEFATAGQGSTFRWTYTFTARGRTAGALLIPFVHTAWARYMAQCADLSVELALGS
jgi:Polyketide cyclase / dehydrase and lipid transport